jgi:hypothetical protein
MTASTVRNRVAAGHLHRIHRGVYAVGHQVLSRHGQWMAAVLACGVGAVLSHRDAAALLGVRPSNRARFDVTAPGRKGKTRARIDVHRADTLTAADVTVVDGIPCTTLARTLLDLAEVVPPRQVERAIDRAEQLRILDLRAIEDLLARSNGRRGARVLRAILAGYLVGRQRTRNELEVRLLELCLEAGGTRPLVNHHVDLDDGGPLIEGDLVYPDIKVIVEADGDQTHGTRAGRETDVKRDRRIRAAGWRVEHFTWREVFLEPGSVVAALRPILSTSAAGRASARPRS